MDSVKEVRGEGGVGVVRFVVRSGGGKRGLD